MLVVFATENVNKIAIIQPTEKTEERDSRRHRQNII